MFYGDFPSIPLISGYNPTEQENPVLHISKFQEPSQTQIDPGFLER
jgi:hypothetical protein